MDPVKAIFYVANLLAICAMLYALRALIIYKIIVKSYTYLCHTYVTKGAELCIKSIEQRA